MLAVIWMTLLFSVMGGADPSEKTYPKGWSIKFSEKLITSEAGLCIVIPCSFTHDTAFIPKSAIWFHNCDHTINSNCKSIFDSKNTDEAEVSFRGRVSLMEPDITQENCSITINDLKESDTGSYQFRVRVGTVANLRISDAYTFHLRKTLKVTGLTQKPKVNVPPVVLEGQQTTLTCTAPGLCSGTPPKITWTWRKTGHNGSLIPSSDTIFETVSQRHSSYLTFTPSSEHDRSEVTCQVTFKGDITTEETVTLNVIYLKVPRIRGNTRVGEGGTLNLTCDVENPPPSTTVIWTDSNKKLMNGTERANLVIPKLTGEHSGRYSCTAQHLTKTLTTFTDITVMTFPVILEGSECVHSLQLRTLICVCISQGIPLPNITWPVLNNKSMNSLTTTVSNFTVNSTFSLTVDDDYNTVKCVSNGYGPEVNKTLIIKKDQNKGIFSIIVKTIIAFLIGLTLSMTICCLAKACNRCTEKKPRDQADMLQMVTCQDQQTGGQGGDGDEQTPQREEKEVEYANIDYTLLKKRSADAERKQETTETEYAEVKREGGSKTQDSSAVDSGTLKSEDEGEEAMIGQHEETEHCTTEEEEGEPLYVSMKAIMGQRETLEGGGEAGRDQNSGAPDSSVPQHEEKEVEYDNNDYSQVKKRSAGAEHEQETTEPESVEFQGEGGDKTQDSGAEDSGTLKSEDEEEEAMIGQHEKTEHLMTEEEEGETEPLYANVS